MKLHFENLSLGIIIFYVIAAVLLGGTWSFFVKIILKNIFKGKLKPKYLFLKLTLILFVFFIITTLLQSPAEFNG